MVEKKHIVSSDVQVGELFDVQYRKGRRVWKGRVTDAFSSDSICERKLPLSKSQHDSEDSDSDDQLSLKEIQKRS